VLMDTMTDVILIWTNQEKTSRRLISMHCRSPSKLRRVHRPQRSLHRRRSHKAAPKLMLARLSNCLPRFSNEAQYGLNCERSLRHTTTWA
jgi:hypothetical protein